MSDYFKEQCYSQSVGWDAMEFFNLVGKSNGLRFA